MNAAELKVLFVISKMGKGGAQRIVLDLANRMAASGARVDLLVFYRTAQDAAILSGLDPQVNLMSLTNVALKADHERSPQKALAIALLPFLTVWWALTNKLAKYHVVHANLMLASLFVWFCSLFRSRGAGSLPKFVETFHADLPTLRVWERGLFLFLWRHMDMLIVELRKKDVQILSHKIPAGRITYIPFGIEPLEAPDARQLGQAADLYAGSPVILSVTRLNQREKKVLDLLHVIHRLSKIHAGPFLFVLVGDGPDKNAAQSLAHSLGISEYVRFTGYVDDFRALASTCRGFLIAGVEDLVGIAGLQAASLGAPIVSFQMDPDWESSEGLFYNSRSYDALAAELERLLSDASYQKKASDYCLAIVRDRFSVQRMADSTLQVYLSLISQP